MKSTADQRKDFERREQNARRLLKASPRAYKVRIVLMAALGYGVIWGGVGASLVLTLGCALLMYAVPGFIAFLVVSKIIFILPIIAWILFRSLKVPFDRPSGVSVSASQAPVLFGELRELSETLDLPKLHEVVLTDEFNAGIMQTPRLGVLGWQRNTLLLGTPMLLALSPSQMRAILAHEAGHLSRNHARFSNWVYRVRMTWYQVMTGFDRMEGWAVAMFRSFFDWYAPAFDALTFPLARKNEFEADSIGVRYTSRETMAQSLVATEVLSALAGTDYWRPLIERASREAQPEPKPFNGLAAFFDEYSPAEDRVQKIIEQQMQVPTGYADTHPSFSDRLEAINSRPVFEPRTDSSAASIWLGDFLSDALDQFNQSWLEENAESWQEAFETGEKARSELQELEAKGFDQLDSKALQRRAELTESALGEKAALSLYEEILHSNPSDAAANFSAGRILFETDESRALTHFQLASEHFLYGLESCELIQEIYRRQGQESKAREWQEKADHAFDLRRKAEFERSNFLDTDKVRKPKLSEEKLGEIAENLQRIGGIKRAYIAEKMVEVAPDLPLYTISLTPKGFMPKSNSWSQEIAAELLLDIDYLLIPKMGQFKSIAKYIEYNGQRVL